MSTTTKTSGKSTFGIELEIIVVAPDAYKYTPHHAVYEALQEKVISLCPFRCAKGHHVFKLPIDDEPPSYWEHEADTNDFSKWIVTRDCSVRLNDDEKQLLPDSHVASDVEIASRILDFSNPSPCPHGQTWPCNGESLMWDWKQEISTIFYTLKQKCNEPGWRVLVNSTCGVHVHLGREQSGFNLDTSKNMMGMFTAFERCFDSLLTVDRICSYEDDHAALPALQLTSDARNSVTPWAESAGVKYSLPLSVRQYEHLGFNMMNAYEKADYMTFNTLTKYGASVPYWLRNIYETTSFADLGQYSTAHTSWCNLENLVHKDTKKPTIEIRCHPGTLETNEIISWVDLLCNLASYAESHTTTSVLAMLESSYANPSFSILDIAKLINASPATITHYTSFLSPTYHSTSSTALSLSTQPSDAITSLYTSITSQHISQLSSPAISSRITSKLISGRYGQFPIDFLKNILSDDIKNAIVDKDARFLSDDMEEKGQEAWAKRVEEVVSEAVERRNGEGGYLLDNLF